MAKSSGRGRTKAGVKAKGGPGGKKGGAKPAVPERVEAGPSPVLERGEVFFFYRPDVGQEAPGGLLDVRRFHVVLRPEGQRTLRLITVGRKALPEPAGDDEQARPAGRPGTHWAFVERVFDDPEGLRAMLSGATYETQTLGERHLPPARPAGEGVYALARHGRNTLLAYALELPEAPGEVQQAFHIARQGHFAVSVKNPEAATPSGLGLDGDRKAAFPDDLLARFGARKWLPVDPPAFLDHEGAEIILVAGRAGDDLDPDLELGLDPQPEDEQTAELFEALALDPGDLPTRPLFEGTWE